MQDTQWNTLEDHDERIPLGIMPRLPTDHQLQKNTVGCCGMLENEDENLRMTSSQSMDDEFELSASIPLGTRTKPSSPARQADTSLIIKRSQVLFSRDPVKQPSSQIQSSKPITGGTGSTTLNEGMSPEEMIKRNQRLPSHFFKSIQPPVAQTQPSSPIQSRALIPKMKTAVQPKPQHLALKKKPMKNSALKAGPQRLFQVRKQNLCSDESPRRAHHPRNLESLVLTNKQLFSTQLETLGPIHSFRRPQLQQLPSVLVSPRGEPMPSWPTQADSKKPPTISMKISNLKNKIARLNNQRILHPRQLLPLSPKCFSPRESLLPTSVGNSPQEEPLSLDQSFDLTRSQDLSDGGILRPSYCDLQHSMASMTHTSTFNQASLKKKNGRKTSKRKLVAACSMSRDYTSNAAKQTERNTFIALTRQLNHLERQESKQAKDRLRVQFSNNYGVRVSDKTAFFTKSTKLEAFLVQRAMVKERHRAARRIQRWFRWTRWRGLVFIILKRMMSAVRHLQRWWRRIFNSKRTAMRMTEVVPFIQRHLRGYLSRKKYLKEICFLRLDSLLGDIEKNELAFKTNLQILLRYRWLKYKRAKAKKEEKAQRSAKLKVDQISPKYLRKQNLPQADKLQPGQIAREKPQRGTQEIPKKQAMNLLIPKPTAQKKKAREGSSARRPTIVAEPVAGSE